MSPDFRDLLSAFNAQGVDYLVVGAPLQDLSEADLTTAGTVFQIGIAPIRIDVLTSIDGVDFDEAWADRLTANSVRCSRPYKCRTRAR